MLNIYSRGHELFIGTLKECKLSAIVVQLTITMLLCGMDFSQKCPFHGGSGPMSKTWLLWPNRVFIQNGHRDRLSHFWTDHGSVPILYNGLPLSSPKLLFPLGGSAWFLGPLELARKWHLDRFSCFCRAHKQDQQTDTQKDWPRYSAVIASDNSLLLHMMWPNKNNKYHITSNLINDWLHIHASEMRSFLSPITFCSTDNWSSQLRRTLISSGWHFPNTTDYTETHCFITTL